MSDRALSARSSLNSSVEWRRTIAGKRWRRSCRAASRSRIAYGLAQLFPGDPWPTGWDALGILIEMIAELIWPGTWLVLEDRDSAFKVESLVRSITTGVMDANLALVMFTGARTREIERHNAAFDERSQFGQQDASWSRKREIEEELLAAADYAGLSPEAAWESRVTIQAQAEIQFNREKWDAGQVPSGLLQREKSLHARSFVYAIDGVWKALEVLAKSAVPSDAQGARDELKLCLPHLIGVRDTSHHQADRARGVDRRGEPLRTPPIDSPLVRAPQGGVVILDSFHDDRYTCTLEDGSLGEVPINLESLIAVQVATQRTLDSMVWTGPPSYFPTDY